jgi:hypothetical protein
MEAHTGKTPGPQVKRAAKAADLLFALGMAPTGRFDLIQRRRSSLGKETVARKHHTHPGARHATSFGRDPIRLLFPFFASETSAAPERLAPQIPMPDSHYPEHGTKSVASR